MKKIVALVLSLVMVLGLATTAFGAITLWAPNGSTAECDIYDAAYNTKQVDSAEVTFVPAKTLKYDKTGAVAQVGVIAHYEYDGLYFVQVNKIPVDADAADYILVKAHDATVAVGDEMVNQSAKDAYYILKVVAEVEYVVKAAEFTAWSDACEAYAAPADADDVDYYTVANKVTGIIENVAVKYAEADDGVPALVGAEVVYLDVDTYVEATAHTWMASKWNEDTNFVTEYVCTECKTVGTVINSPVNAPAGAKIDNMAGTLIAYTYGVTAAAGDKVESAETFDAGIAMYVGMSVMAAAGSAVVLKKKD